MRELNIKYLISGFCLTDTMSVVDFNDTVRAISNAGVVVTKMKERSIDSRYSFVGLYLTSILDDIAYGLIYKLDREEQTIEFEIKSEHEAHYVHRSLKEFEDRIDLSLQIEMDDMVA